MVAVEASEKNIEAENNMWLTKLRDGQQKMIILIGNQYN